FGADCVLVIMAAVTDAQGRELVAAAAEAGLDVLVEVHGRAELERAAALGATLIGINNRDLATFRVALETTEHLAAAVPAGADFLGLNFHPSSPRAVTPERAREIADAVPGAVLVGIFVDAPRARVEDVAARIGLAAVQFSGEEDPQYCRGWPWRVVKAIRA